MAPAFQQLLGEQLSSVTFAQDYLQLAFDGPVLSVFMPVSVRSSGLEISSGDERFRDALCAQIANRVEDVALRPDDALTIRFEDGAEISISLRPDDYSGPEAFEAHGLGDSIIVYRADDQFA